MTGSGDIAADDIFARLRQATQARIGLGRAGSALPTAALLDLRLAHARARDAVHDAPDWDALAHALGDLPVTRVHSQAADRTTYLQRPDLGRLLDAASAQALTPGPPGIAFVIADGLSASAVQNHAAPLLHRIVAALDGADGAQVILAQQGRVAIGDAIGERLGADIVLVLIGERPGLSSHDSLGAYLTFGPRPGRRDNERNCVSNIRPQGLGYDEAAATIAWLIRRARERGCTGVALKDESRHLSREDDGLLGYRASS